ncbi:phosphoglucosamine mutase [Natrialba sp. INN-245]|uniref:phosphoglucosamine mutase n=1 Tax=Natrialba sp. INN-245 TaxID=2690967 RepID=UPI00130FC434|nr:phosphoglucosamine mutase [Natrialba sp. INN-245]MWV41673.1 phosphoglucosamine mutase [Natrialba sp. INN-245]
MEVFGSSGTRGVANEELTPAFVLRVAKAAGTAWGVDRVAIARDTRSTGRMLADAVASGLASTGTDVDRLGTLPTPGAQYYAERESVPVIVVTASHNPPQYNGIKLVGADGVELAVSDLERIEETLLAEGFAVAPWDETGRVRTVDGVTDDYVDELLASVDRASIADAELTVALDPGHGAGSLTSPEFFRELGCRVVTVNGQPDGHFPGRDPEPVVDNLEDLGRLVRATDADVGIAHDGDADRAIFFDEDGEYVQGDATLAALAAAELEAGETAVSAVNVSQRLVDVVTDVGAELELTPIGSTNIITRIRELEATGERVPIAGEGNGGIFFPEYRLSRDGAFTAARFLELVAERPVSEIVSPYDGYANVRRNVSYSSTAERDAMLDAAANHAKGADAELNTRDGYRLDYGDAWVLARPSGTEPLVRVYAEAREEDRATELADGMYETLESTK